VSALPRDFESSEQAHASQDRQAERRHDVGVRQDQLQDTANHDEAIETVEQRDEVALKTETRKRRFFYFSGTLGKYIQQKIWSQAQPGGKMQRQVFN
jgi:hypothetical protein